MVKQRQPTTVDDAVSATLEMQSYVHFAGDEAKPPEEAIVAAVRSQQETLMGMMQHVVERLDKLETQQKQPRRSQSPRPWRPRGRQWNRGVAEGTKMKKMRLIKTSELLSVGSADWKATTQEDVLHALESSDRETGSLRSIEPCVWRR